MSYVCVSHVNWPAEIMCTYHSMSLATGPLKYTVKQPFDASEKIMRICRNRPLDKFLFMRSSALCIVTYMYGAIKIYATYVSLV